MLKSELTNWISNCTSNSNGMRNFYVFQVRSTTVGYLVRSQRVHPQQQVNVAKMINKTLDIVG